MKKYFKIVVTIVLILTKRFDAAKILAVFPSPSISHHYVFRPLTQELVKRGHEVVVITTNPAYPPGQAPKNLTEIDLHDISYNTWQKVFISSDIRKLNPMKQCSTITRAFTTVFESQLQTKEVQKIIKNENNETFDLLLLESCVRPVLAFRHIYKAPVISISSNGPLFGTYASLGIPTHPLLYPLVSHQRVYNLTYFEKVKELYYHYATEYVYHSLEEEEHEMLKKYFGADIPPLNELIKNIDMFFQNVHPVLMDNPPVPPCFVYIGGIHQKPPKPLPQDLLTYLNSSKNGVVYVSFGTNMKVSLLPPEKIQMMMRAFSKLPNDVLWKTDINELPGISTNIRLSKWLPQADLLRHHKIKAFVTHGGQQSSDEAITGEVPLIGIPMFGDQWFNVEKFVLHKIGVKLEWDSLTDEELRNAILTVIEDESYLQNIKRLKKIINDQPQSPLERAIWWTEHVLRHGGAKHLRAPAANMSWTEYYEIELVFILIGIVLFVIFVLSFFSYFMWVYVSKFFTHIIKMKTI